MSSCSIGIKQKKEVNPFPPSHLTSPESQCPPERTCLFQFPSTRPEASPECVWCIKEQTSMMLLTACGGLCSAPPSLGCSGALCFGFAVGRGCASCLDWSSGGCVSSHESGFVFSCQTHSSREESSVLPPSYQSASPHPSTTTMPSKHQRSFADVACLHIQQLHGSLPPPCADTLISPTFYGATSGH